jgi:Zn-dependent M28 family amino/carboxypeptidase
VTGTVVPVDTDGTPSGTSTSGCEAGDFGAFPIGAIALLQRGTCPFGQKAALAEDAGAVAAIVFNGGLAGATGAIAGTLGSPLVEIPVVGASHAVGLDLMDPAGTVVHIQSSTESEIRPTWNVLAETTRGDDANVVMAGAHLDSVVVGPGVNDNGSGSGSLLEVAEQMSKVKPVNTVRFAWWGAEELGLLGSNHYVSDLAEHDPAALQDIALYLNFDMVGSPNYVRFVYDGDNSRFPVGPSAAEGPEGSCAIEQMFHDYFGSQALASEETPFSGRSDYGPFIAEGIPAGGLFTGAEGVKTEEQAEVFGGQAGVAYDKCYHQACDDLSNVNMDAIDEMSDAVAHAILSYAMDTRAINGDGKGHPVSPPGQHGTAVPAGTGTAEGGGLHDDHDHDRDAS